MVYKLYIFQFQPLRQALLVIHNFMIRYILLLFTFFIAACGTSSADQNVTIQHHLSKADTTNSVQNTVTTNNNLSEDTANYESATYFVIVADTGSDYYLLNKKMYTLGVQTGIPIDTMGRFYNSTKNLIALPDNSEDEIYAGDYFPRRFPSQNLSLEYLNFYSEKAGEKTIALVTGIYETENSADSAMTALQKTGQKAFKIKADIYVGCLH